MGRKSQPSQQRSVRESGQQDSRWKVKDSISFEATKACQNGGGILLVAGFLTKSQTPRTGCPECLQPRNNHRVTARTAPGDCAKSWAAAKPQRYYKRQKCTAIPIGLSVVCHIERLCRSNATAKQVSKHENGLWKLSLGHMYMYVKKCN